MATRPTTPAPEPTPAAPAAPAAPDPVEATLSPVEVTPDPADEAPLSFTEAATQAATDAPIADGSADPTAPVTADIPPADVIAEVDTLDETVVIAEVEIPHGATGQGYAEVAARSGVDLTLPGNVPA